MKACKAFAWLFITLLATILETFVDAQPISAGFLRPSLGSFSVLGKDRPVFSLSDIVTGPKITYKVEESEGFNTTAIQHTFRDFETPKPLDGSPQNCKTFVYITANKYAFICDNKYLLFTEFDSKSGGLLNSSSIEIPIEAGSSCTGLETSGDRYDLYFTCLLPVDPSDGTRTMKLFMVDTAASKIIDTTASKESNEQGIFNNLAISSFNTKVQQRKESLLFVYERKESTNIRLQLFKSNRNRKLVAGGYFSTKTNITGVLPGHGFLQIVVIDQSMFFVLRNSTNLELYLQQCLPSPVYSQLNCLDVRIPLGCKSVDVLFDSHRPLEPQRDPSYRFVVATLGTLRLYKVDPTTSIPKVSFMIEANIKDSSLASIMTTFVWGEKIYVSGNNKDSKPVLLLYRTLQNSYEEKILESETIYDVSFVRKGSGNPNMDFHVAIGDKQLWTSLIYTAQVMPILPNALAPYTLNYKILCYSAGVYTNSLTFSLSVLPKVTSNASLALPKVVNSFAGSDLISIPLAKDEFRGNAPLFRANTNDTSVKLAGVNYVTEITKLSMPEISGVKKFFFIGADLFILASFEKIQVLKCSTNSTFRAVGQTAGKCEVKLTEQVDNKQYILDAAVLGDYVLILISNSSFGSPQKEDTISLKITNFAGLDYTQTFTGYSATVGVVEAQGGVFTCFIAAAQPGITLQQKLFNLKVQIGSAIPRDWSYVLTLASHICPTEMQYYSLAFASLSLSSSCGKNDDSRVYGYNIVDSDLEKSHLVKSYSDLGSNSFGICPTSSELGIIDLDGAKIFSIDTTGSEDYKIYYPLSEYKLDKILDYHCDQRQNIFQVLAYSTENKYTKLVTYRAESQNRPNLRVHSVHPVSDKVKHIASTYNKERDHLTTVLISNMAGTADDESMMLELYLGAPYFYFASKGTTETWVNITYTAVFQAAELAETASLAASQILHLMPMSTDLQVVSKGGARPALPQDGNIAPLENLISTYGPTKKITCSADPKAAVVYDRFTESSQFRVVETVLKRVVMDRAFAFGWDSKGFLLLFGEQKLPLAEREIGKGIALGRSGNGKGFYALTLSKPQSGSLNQVVAFLQIEGNWQTFVHTFQNDGLIDMKFFRLDDTTFGAVGIRGDTPQIECSIFGLENGDFKMIFNTAIRTSDSVNSFEAMYLDKLSHLVVIVNLHQSISADFYLMKVNTQNKQVLLVTTQTLELVPGVPEIPDYNPLSCVHNFRDENVIDCVHTGYDMYSYVISYTIKTNPTAEEKYISARENLKLRNIVNYTPRSVTTTQNYTAISVSPTSDSAIGDLVLIYAMQVQDYPFRVLSSEDFGLEKTSLKYLSPCFFDQQDGASTKLGVNLGTTNASLRVYNIDFLKLLLKDASLLKPTDSILFHSLSGATTPLKLQDIFFWNQNDPSKKSDKKKNYRWVIYLIIGAVLLAGLVAMGISYKNRAEQEKNDGRSESLFDTRVEDGNTIRADDQSRIGN